jgi:predicted nucleic acid-binding Zn ribbon protein
MSVGISIGIAIGVAMGPLFDNIGIGIAIGIALGSGIGASLEQKNKDNIRQLMEEERVRQKWAVIAGWIITSLAFVSVLILLLLRAR